METSSALLALCVWGNSPVTGEFPAKKASDAELWCFHWSVPWINGWVNNRGTCILRPNRSHYDVIVMNAHGLVRSLLWFNIALFAHILQDHFTGIRVTMQLFQFQWRNPEGYGWMYNTGELVTGNITKTCANLMGYTLYQCAALGYHHVHYSDVIINTMASQITSLTIVYSTVYSAADQRKYHRWIPRINDQ